MQPIWSLGLMSGTSMDGVDAAMLRTDGVDLQEFGDSYFHSYGADHRAMLKATLKAYANQSVDPARNSATADAVIVQHKLALEKFAQTPDVIGFHGQTVFHDPANAVTVQLGDGASLSEHPVVWDFRTADLLSGGEGAPLAPFFHFALARHAKLDAPVAFLNLGGVGNITWVNPRAAEPEAPDALLAFDTGPANALLDDFIRARTGARFDKDGALAAKGRADEAILAQALAHAYFERCPPKSLDRDTFAGVLDMLAGLSTEDGLATLTAFSAQSVHLAARWFPEPVSEIFTCGGGRHNATMISGIEVATNVPVRPVEALGFDGDMLEAQAFAYLAVRVLRGLPTSSPSTTGCRVPVSGGRITGYFPSSDV